MAGAGQPGGALRAGKLDRFAGAKLRIVYALGRGQKVSGILLLEADLQNDQAMSPREA